MNFVFEIRKFRFLKEKDLYNNEIMKIARPFPLEYLIIDIPTGFPAENTRLDSIFNDQCSIIQTPFSIENRQQISELQVTNPKFRKPISNLN